MKYKTNKFGSIVLGEASASYLNYCRELENSELLILMLGLGWKLINENKEKAKKLLIDFYEDPSNDVSIKFVEYLKSDGSDIIFDIRTYEQYFGQLSYARLIDNVLTYFKDVLAEVILKVPNILKSTKDKADFEFILNCESITELRIALAEKKITTLFYGNIDKIEEFFINQLNIELFKTTDDRTEFAIATKNRNLIVHNRGRINADYVRKFPQLKYKEGQVLIFTYEDISNINLILNNFIALLDIEISERYALDMIKNG